MEFDTFIHLLMKALAGSAVGWVKCCVVAIGTSPTSHLSVAVGAGKSRIQHNLLQTLPIFPLEISHERIISFPIRETVLLKHISMNSRMKFLQSVCAPFCVWTVPAFLVL